jgi:hypothetical protein
MTAARTAVRIRGKFVPRNRSDPAEFPGERMTKPSRTFEIPVDRLIELTEKSLRGIGVPEDDIEIVRDVLLYAELRGNNQGLVKIPARGVLPRADAKPVEITRRVACAALIKRQRQFGHGGRKPCRHRSCRSSANPWRRDRRRE